MKLTGAEILCESLTQLGVRDLFGYPGGAILPVYDALGKSKLHHVLVRHEQGATHMADGYARASGEVGVAMATSGPGATNMVTGIATAMLDSSPVVVHHRAGYQQIARLRRLPGNRHHRHHHADHQTQRHRQRAEDIARTVREAFLIANTGRPGPVLVDITKDAQQATCEFDWDAAAPKLPVKRKQQELRPGRIRSRRGTPQHRQAPADFGRSRHHAFRRDATSLREFVRTANIPVAMTLLGIGCFPANDPLNLGMMGMHGEAWVNHAIQEADLLIAVGMRFDDRVTGDLRTYAQNRAQDSHRNRPLRNQ